MHHLLLVLVLSALPVSAAERWEELPPTPGPIHSERSGQANANGISIHYAVYGQGSPVILLHGGLANADYWGNQIKALAPHHTVIVMDSRGHGRSTRDSRPYGYDLMADDVVALMDVLKVPKADIVGWSDGAILGLDLAMRHPGRVGKIFAFAANTVTSGVKDGWRGSYARCPMQAPTSQCQQLPVPARLVLPRSRASRHRFQRLERRRVGATPRRGLAAELPAYRYRGPSGAIPGLGIRG